MYQSVHEYVSVLVMCVDTENDQCQSFFTFLMVLEYVLHFWLVMEFWETGPPFILSYLKALSLYGWESAINTTSSSTTSSPVPLKILYAIYKEISIEYRGKLNFGQG
jgi:hypothetical protein